MDAGSAGRRRGAIGAAHGRAGRRAGGRRRAAARGRLAGRRRHGPTGRSPRSGQSLGGPGAACTAWPVRRPRGAGMSGAPDADVRRGAAAAAGHGAGRAAPSGRSSSLPRLAAAGGAAVLVVLAGGLLLRARPPALWARSAGGPPAPGVGRRPRIALVPWSSCCWSSPAHGALRRRSTPSAGVLPDPGQPGGGSLTCSPTAAAELREQATPALPLAGLLALTTRLRRGVAVVVDLVAVAGRQAALAGVGLLACTACRSPRSPAASGSWR